MADNGTTENITWPMPQFRFEVDFDTRFKGVAFQEVSGLDEEVQPVEYRNSNSKLFSVAKMPGIAKYGIVTMKRGIFVNDLHFWDWMKEIEVNTISRRTVLIKLLDESGEVTMQWQLNNAWPTKVSGTDLKSNGNEVTVHTLEIAHEQLIVTNGKGV